MEAFLEQIQRVPALWQAIDVRTVAAFVEGAWRNLVTQVYLRSMLPGHVPRVDNLADTVLRLVLFRSTSRYR